jgi:hypothetical protein
MSICHRGSRAMYGAMISTIACLKNAQDKSRSSNRGWEVLGAVRLLNWMESARRQPVCMVNWQHFDACPWLYATWAAMPCQTELGC